MSYWYRGGVLRNNVICGCHILRPGWSIHRGKHCGSAGWDMCVCGHERSLHNKAKACRHRYVYCTCREYREDIDMIRVCDVRMLPYGPIPLLFRQSPNFEASEHLWRSDKYYSYQPSSPPGVAGRAPYKTQRGRTELDNIRIEHDQDKSNHYNFGGMLAAAGVCSNPKHRLGVSDGVCIHCARRSTF